MTLQWILTFLLLVQLVNLMTETSGKDKKQGKIRLYISLVISVLLLVVAILMLIVG
ncbi:hypothetical protein [Staphylococcus pasteuri]|uniref:hypothetical protein n=1 Tax=Staphylococcus pasteuri TaxID=45972 RepID=UPI001C3FE1D4|nr:hypothetical protein [Staphylococcus pasteuri]